MLILTNAGTDKLQLVTSAAVAIDVHSSWTDLLSTVVTPGRTNTAISTATTTDIVGTPAASTIRNVNGMKIRNKSTTTSCDVTVQYNQNGTLFELIKITLQAGATLEFVEGVGFFVVETAYSTLSRRLALGSDVNNAGVTPAAITGLQMTTGLGTFKFQYLIRYQAAAVTTGVGFSINHTGTLSFFLANELYVDTSATASTGAPDQDAIAATAQVYGAFAYRAKSSAAAALTASVDTANADMLMIIDGILQVTADGNLELWHRSEVAATSTVKSGSVLILERISA